MTTTPDSSGNGHTLTAVGTTADPASVASPWSGFTNAAYFPAGSGTGSGSPGVGFLAAAWDSGGVPAISGTGAAAAFTLEARLRPTGAVNYLGGNIAGWFHADQPPQLYGDIIGNTYTLYWTDDTGGSFNFSGGVISEKGNVVAADYDGTNMRLYVDGVMVAKQATTGLHAYNSGDAFGVGTDQQNENQVGTIDEVRWSNVARYASDAGYTPASSPFTTDAHTLALYHLDTISGSTSAIAPTPAFGWGVGAMPHTNIVTVNAGPINPGIGVHTINGPLRPVAFGWGVGSMPRTNILAVQGPPALGWGIGSMPGIGNVSPPIAPTEPGYAFLSRVRTFRASASVFVPPVAPPATIHLADLGIPRVSETFNPPTVVNGLPYASSALDEWEPASVTDGVWAKQLQVIVGHEDVTFFRGAPTIIASWSSQEPFGDASAVFQLPAVTSFDNLREPLAVPVGATVGMAATESGNGYWTTSALGLVTGFGDAGFFGDPLGLLNELISGIAAHPGGQGYALCAGDGGVFCFGAQGFFGSLPGIPVVPNRPIVGIAITASGNGYWLLGADGGIFAFGDAPFLGSAPIPGGDSAVAIARTGGGGGYIVLSAAGHIYIFGTGGTYLGGGEPFYVAPYVGLATYPGTDGYLMVNSLGSAYAKGGITYEGGVTFPLNAPANSVTLSAANSYWIGAEDGGVFAFNAPFYGSVPGGGTTAGGSLSWLSLGADVTINAIHPDNSVFTVFEGVIADWEDNATIGSIGLSVQCTGSLFQLDWYIAKPIPNLPFQGYSPETGSPIFGWDIAQAIPQAIASVFDPTPGTSFQGLVLPARQSPFNANACVLELPGGASEAGILTVTQPAWDKVLTSYIQNILSQAQSFGGLQYTVNLQRPRTPVLKVKDFETVNWTISTGGHGVQPNLSLDITTAANAIYGSGSAPPVLSTVTAGSSTTTVGLTGTWQGAKYPQFPPNPGPTFPLGAGHYAPGDGQTGLQVFTNWMRQSGWPMVSQDTYLATSPGNGVLDYYLILQWQTMAGLEQTGLIDAATWNVAFYVGWNTGAVANVYYGPLAELAEVEPYYYTPSGALLGNNPFYNPMVPRIERYEAMGSQVSKSQGILSATIELNKIQVPSWTGTITLGADPEEGSRFEVLAGQNILLRFWHGRDVLFHISAVSVDFSTGGLTVSLTVASQPIDLIQLAAIYARDYGAHGVSRQARPSLVNLNISSNTTTFDSESSAGQLPPLLVPAHGWNIYRMGASQSGSIAEVNLTASPATPFAVAVFSGPVTVQDLEAIFTLSNGPLNNNIATGNNPWNDFAAQLDALGLLYGAGGPTGPCGFWPSDPGGTQTLTGRYVDSQTWPYTSAPGYSPWLWVAIFCQNEAFVSGRFLPAPSTL